ncbi:hypothetical protein [Oceanirhabdus sp. W0125-5]|uniref:hypothetical protein n=1 Tax=Oceanirhabdus sp. W0125-5 TaxID=2999116 RepID=UPI0022F2D183|nr:hypothetical protein [Oceanirhabdus sp. W0125-5]WBW97207.1 hypothetical protein OW730_26490 [Oceanirhabdus sp. W0125-5]
MHTEMIKFWEWFVEKEEWIINHADRGEVVYAIDDRLKEVFSYFDGELEFEFCFFKGKGEFNFFDLNIEKLNKDAQLLKNNMPVNLSKRWCFNISH